MEVATLVTDNKTKQRYSPALTQDIRGPGTAPHTQLQIHSTDVQKLCLELECL